MRKKLTKPKLIKKLDRIFSLYIRLKYSDKNWMCTCISCWKKLYYKKMHNCHWISRGKMLYRFDEDNCRPWCPWCNTYDEYNHLKIFENKLIKKLGKKRVEEMKIKSKEIKQFKIFELEEMIEYYKKKIKYYIDNKNL